jgi:hypothetical protein
MTRGLLLTLALAASMAQTRPPDALVTQARRLYNEQQYEEAIRIASQARLVPALASAAAVVFARAHLESYRVDLEPVHLDEARAALGDTDVSALAPLDRVEFAIALGALIYLDDTYMFDDRYAAAAEQFEVALGRADLLDAPGRDHLFEWWASSLDRQAQLGPESERRVAYTRILRRAEEELARDTAATSASYWLAAGARGTDDLPRAWGAAVAGWVRAASLGPRGTALREDLDRLVVQVILPERALQLASGGDPKPVLASLEAQWQAIKERWR